MMKSKILIGALVASALLDLQAQSDSLALHYAATITPEELRGHLEVIAADDYEGRDTGAKGQKMTAEYLKAHFMAYGIPPVPDGEARGIVDGYFQPFDLFVEQQGGLSFEAGGNRYVHLRDHFSFGDRVKSDVKVDEVIYLGDGTSVPQGLEATGGVVMISSTRRAEDPAEAMRSLVMEMMSGAAIAEMVGARILLLVSEDTRPVMEEMGHFLGGSRMKVAALEEPGKPVDEGLQTLMLTPEAAEDLLSKARLSLKKLRKKKPGHAIALPLSFTYEPQRRTVVSENVLGYIEGSEWPDELVVVTAHYDHIGVEDGEIYNGADDNGSGTVAVMAMARAFAEAKAAGQGPRRSVLFMPVTAEEKGLLGSKYYSEFPVFPLENTVANLNIDMIGRTDSVHEGGAPYVYVIGSDRLSSGLHAVNEEANALVGLELDYTFNAENDPQRLYYRSDHYNFARKGVPAVFYFSGLHEDYHGPGDTVDKVQYDLLHQRTLLVFHTAWKLANREERIEVDVELE